MQIIAESWLPSRARLDAATARTTAAIAAGASPAEIQHAAELEEAVHTAYLQRPGADAELQREAEIEAAA